MKHSSIWTLSIIIAAACAITGRADAATLSVAPLHLIQGDPIMISVEGTSSADITFAGKALGVFVYKGRPTALYGFDINKRAGTYAVAAKLSDGTVLTKDVEVGERKKAQVAFTIPVKLGGNTASSQAKLSSTLSTENGSLLGLRTGTHAFWNAGFIFPVADSIVTDTYGYSRLTGVTTITHKGTDFHAPEGTPIVAINRGVVRLVQETRNYGKTVVIDHGLGLMSFYMHLSKISVNEGQLVLRGEPIGLSGHTGYAEQAHLHLTVRINDASIDPLRFLELFP